MNRIHVFLLAGQSNADGRAEGADLRGPSAPYARPRADIPFYYHTHGSQPDPDGTLGKLATLAPGGTQFPAGGFGPELSLGRQLAEGLATRPATRIALIKYAKGGSKLHSDWKPDSTGDADGPHFKTFQKVVKDGLLALQAAYPRAHITLDGMFWVQGESDLDGGIPTASAYGDNLASLVRKVRTLWGADLPFIFTRLSRQQTLFTKPGNTYGESFDILRAGQSGVAGTLKDVFIVDIDGKEFSTKADKLHFDAAGQLALGAALADALLASPRRPQD